nr:thioredoxin domain-containing protein [Actinomycetales bacterium]
MARQDNTRLTKLERRELAREKARVLREEQEKREKRNRMLLIGGILGVIVIVALVVVAIVMNSNRSAFADVAEPAGTEEGGFSLSALDVAGDSTGDPKVQVYLDYACSWCNLFEQQYAADIKEMNEAGEAEFWFYPVALLDNSNDFTAFSGLAANASGTVMEHAPDQWAAFNEQLFITYAANPSAMLPEIEAAAATAGVPAEVIARFADGEFRDWVDATTRNFLRNVARGTPEVRVDGETLVQWTDENALQDAIAAARG